MKIIAHRGASVFAPQNTMPAFEEGWRCGSDGVEMDLHLTADGKIAVIHDFSTENLTDGEMVVAESTMSELKSLDAGVVTGDEWAGTLIPELSEVLAVAPSGKELVLELKSGAEILPALTDCIKRSNVSESDIVVISFNDSIFEVKNYLPNARCYFLESDPEKLDASLAKSAEAGLTGLDLAWKLIDASVMDSAKSAGLDIYVWTVDDVDIAKKMRDFGVSALTTNTPAEMIAVLG
ncbi:MAG: hypothetical protein KAG97_01605 [Victivallales bacterium]|nr:hypothetical protein [Victivallales bacterium]